MTACKTAIVLAAAVAAVAATAASADPKYVEFDAPGAMDTWVQGFGSKGDTTGRYMTKDGFGDSFIRTKKGVYTYLTPGGTDPHFINARRQTSGLYNDRNGAHGFIGAADGTWQSFDVPGNHGFNPFTAPMAITDTGAIVGYYGNGDVVSKGFIRRPLGKVVTFAIDDLFNRGTFATAMTEDGFVYGHYLDKNLVSHGFIRDTHGAFSHVDVPGAGGVTSQGSWIAAANASHTIAGTYVDPDNQQHAYLRLSGGSAITIDLPQGSWDISIRGLNSANAVVGYYQDSQMGDPHTFLRTPDGQVVSVDEPLAFGHGTEPAGINDKGEIGGFYVDGWGNSHGFLRKDR